MIFCAPAASASFRLSTALRCCPWLAKTFAAYLSIQRRINEAYADNVRRSREYFT